MKAVIISCSGKKVAATEPQAAVEVYDGPYFRTIRKLMAEGNLRHDVDIFILSAKHGLLRSEDHIMPYDMRMNKETASSLNAKVLAKLTDAMLEREYDELVINLGRDYLPAIDGSQAVIAERVNIRYFQGTIIARRKQLKEYLASAN